MKKNGLTFAVLLLLLTFAISSCEDYGNNEFTIGDYAFTTISSDEVELTKVNWSIQTASLPPTISHQGVTYRVTSIGDEAFYKCSSLTSITIPESVTSIGEMAFRACFSLTSITIPESVTSIGDRAFSSCSSLTSMVVESGNSTYDSRDNCNAIIKTATNTLIAGCQNTIIPNSVTSIGERAFAWCSSLTSITIGNGVKSIGEEAFLYCSSLTSITIPESVTSIGEEAFYDCDSLTAITIGNGVKSIGERAFESCSALTKTNYTGDIASWCNIKFGGSYANPISQSRNFYINDQEIKDLIIPDGVTSIGDWAFSGCDSLTSVTIPNSVTSIGDRAFSNCDALTSIAIGNGVKSIGEGAFSNCSSLTSLTIPNSVTSLGEWAFESCNLLKAIDYTGTKAQWKKIKNQKECIIGSSIRVIRCTDGEIVI